MIPKALYVIYLSMLEYPPPRTKIVTTKKSDCYELKILTDGRIQYTCLLAEDWADYFSGEPQLTFNFKYQK